MESSLWQVLIVFSLLTTINGEYYEGLREFYRRETYTGSENPTKCEKYTGGTYCVATIRSEAIIDGIYVDETACDPNIGAHCFVNQSDFGICLQDAGFEEPSVGFPGDACSDDSQCLFGPRRCGSNGACQGVSKYGACRQSADCVTRHFCSYGHCIPILTQGSSCSSSEDCGREAVCLFTDASSIFGVCTNVLSLEVGSTVFYKDSDGKIAYVEGGEKACRSAWVDKEEGRCSDGVQSKNKEEPCKKADDCATSRTEVLTPCLAGYNKDGKFYCDIDGADEEWVEAREAFAEYMVKSKVCHNAARWSECGAPEEYKKWRCAEAKALHYVKLRDNLPCMKNMYASFPGLRDYQKFCSGSWFTIGWITLVVLLVALL